MESEGYFRMYKYQFPKIIHALEQINNITKDSYQQRLTPVFIKEFLSFDNSKNLDLNNISSEFSEYLFIPSIDINIYFSKSD